MGGPDYPGCGFAAGVERIRLLCVEKQTSSRPHYYVAVAIGKKNRVKALDFINLHRLKTHPNVSIEFICRDNLAKGLRYAREKKADYALILGEDEINSDKIIIKELKTRKQKKIDQKKLLTFLLEPEKNKF